jgi:hypothetical protein
MTATTMAAASAERTGESPAGMASYSGGSPAPEHEFLGISGADCPIDCCEEKCVISGAPICAHPNKCGLQPVHRMDRATVERFNRARRLLALADVNRKDWSR